MKNKPIIGIAGRFDTIDNLSMIALNDDYRLAVVKAGGIPLIIIPNSEYSNKLIQKEIKELRLILEKCDGFIMPGGTKWHEFDEIICKYALEMDKPILGICLGMQILGSIDTFCGTQDSDKTLRNMSEINHCQKGVRYVHKCYIVDGLLKEILKKDEIMVNSRHNYHIIEKDYFNVEAYSEDGLIEAISIPNHKFALGVQWHPESMLTYDNEMLKIFTAFIKSTK